VGDQLAEERPPGGFGGVVGIGIRRVEHRGGVAGSPGLARPDQQLGINAQGDQVREHASVAGFADRPVHRTNQIEAMVASGDLVTVGT